MDPVLLLGLLVYLYLGFVYTIAFLSKEDERSWDKTPKVSIIVPAYNEEENIGETLESLLALDYPDFEIIVVDDGSTDGTYEVAKKYEGDRVKVIRQENRGKGAALNTGIRNARGEILACMDADSVVEPDALRKMIPFFQDPRVMAVTANMMVKHPKNLIQGIQYVEYALNSVMRRALAFLNAQYVTPGPFSLYRREFFEKHGYFREDDITEDMEMGMRITYAGYRIENAVDAYVYTEAPGTLRGLVKQRLRWYLGFIDNVIRYRSRVSFESAALGLFVIPFSLMGIFFGFYFHAKTLFDLPQATNHFLTTLSALGPGVIHLFLPRFDPLSFLAAHTETAVLLLMMGISVGFAAAVSSSPRTVLKYVIPTVIFLPVLYTAIWLAVFFFKLFCVPIRFGNLIYRGGLLCARSS